MKRYGATLALIGVAAILGFYLVLVDTPRQREREEEQERATRVVDLKEDDLKSLELVTKNGRMVLERGGADAWRLTTPVASEVDESVVRRLVTQLTTLTVMRSVENMGDASEAGLDHSNVRVTARTATGETVLEFGSLNPAGSGVYVRRSDQKVFLVDQSAKTTFDVAPYDLRMKEFFNFDPSTVTAAAVTIGGRTFRLERRQDAWSILDPPVAADPDTVSSLLSRLRALKTSAFFDTPEQRRSVPLAASPKISIELTTSERTLKVAFSDARHAPPDEIYARTGSDDLYRVSQHLLAEMPLTVTALRDMRLARVFPHTVRGLEVTTPNETYQLVRSGPSAAWELDKQPLASDAAVRVNDFLDAVLLLQGESIVAESLGQAPQAAFNTLAARIELQTEGQKSPTRITIGAESGERRYSYSGSSGPVFLIASDILGRIPTRASLQSPKASK